MKTMVKKNSVFGQNGKKKSEYFLIRICWIGRDPTVLWAEDNFVNFFFSLLRFYTFSALKSPKFVIFWNWSFFHLFSNPINFFGVISYFPCFFWEKKPKKGVWLLKYLNFMRLLSRISGENSIIWHIFLDSTLFHGIWVNSAPVSENSSNFAKI